MDLKLFPSFFDKPQDISFAEQEQDEHIELFLRRHAITNIGWIVASIVAFILPALFLRLDQQAHFAYTSQISTQAQVATLIVWYMLLLAYVFEQFLFWYFNIYIVTNFHIVEVNFLSLMFREITEIELKDIESVSTQIGGIIRPLFNFGDVLIETAAKDQGIKFTDVPKPDIVSDRIEDLRAAVKTGGTE